MENLSNFNTAFVSKHDVTECFFSHHELRQRSPSTFATEGLEHLNQTNFPTKTINQRLHCYQKHVTVEKEALDDVIRETKYGVEIQHIFQLLPAISS